MINFPELILSNTDIVRRYYQIIQTFPGFTSFSIIQEIQSSYQIMLIISPKVTNKYYNTDFSDFISNKDFFQRPFQTIMPFLKI